MVCRGRRLSDELHLTIDAQNLRHLGLKLGVAALQVITDLVRLDLLLVEDVAQRALSKLAQAGMAFLRSVFASMPGEEPRRPQLVRIAKLLGLAAGQVRQPSLGLGRDRRLSPGARQIVERRNGAVGHCAFNAALHSLMMHPYSPSHGVKGRVFPVCEQHSRPFDPARRLRPRTRHRIQFPHILFAKRQFKRLPPPRHDLAPGNPNQAATLQAMSAKMNPAHMIAFTESMN